MNTFLEKIPDWARPGRVLNPAFAPEAPWAVELLAGREGAALAAFVCELRNGPARLEPENAYVNLVKRWYGMRMGHQGGHDYQPDLVVRRDYIGCYGIRHQFTGEIDWLYDPTVSWGPEHTWEWQVQLNRHYQWGPLANAWRETGNPAYAKAFEAELLSWIGSQCPRPPALDMRLPGTWRTIEVGIRSGWTWPYAFETFRRCPEVSDLALWLLVAAMREHGYYLLYHPRAGNFKTMESNGLAHVGLLFPELEGAYSFASTAVDRCMAEMERQFYPDGLQTELAPAYGLLSVANIFCALDLARRRAGALDPGKRLMPVPPQTWARLRQLGTALARIALPDGRVPQLNDSTLVNAGPVFQDMQQLPGGNPTTAGQPPFNDGHSLADTVAWPGYGVLRRPGRVALLDAGPYSTGHSHHDALHLILHGGGFDWCIDSGCPRYDQSDITRLMRHAPGHNLVLMDGAEHEETPLLRRVEAPLPLAAGEFGPLLCMAAGRNKKNLDSAGAGFSHERLVFDIPDAGWLVVDRLRPHDNAPHAWEWLWHFPVAARLETGAGTATASVSQSAPQTGAAASLLVQAQATAGLAAANVGGRQTPSPRGWTVVSGSREAQPLPTLQFLSTPQPGEVWAATLFTLETPGCGRSILLRSAECHSAERHAQECARSILLRSEELPCSPKTFQLSLKPTAAGMQVRLQGENGAWILGLAGTAAVETISVRAPGERRSKTLELAPHSTMSTENAQPT